MGHVEKIDGFTSINATSEARIGSVYLSLTSEGELELPLATFLDAVRRSGSTPMTEQLTLTLSRDEALVLFEWLARFNSDQEPRFEDQAEQRVLWDLAASLESVLVEPLRADYAQLLAAARDRVRDSSE